MQTPSDSEPGAALIERMIVWNDAPTNVESDGNLANLARSAPVKPRIIPFSADAESRLMQSAAEWRARKQQTRGSGLDALWARAYEHALRLALIVGAGSSGMIDRQTALWACELVEFLLSRTAAQATACVATNEYEGSVQKVQAFIRQQQSVTLATLTRKFRSLKTKERDGILSGLLDAQQIEISTEKTAGRQSTTILWVDGK
jgi:hypothetical protein